MLVSACFIRVPFSQGVGTYYIKSVTMYITKNFTLAELTKTSVKAKNEPDALARLWLKILAVSVLQPLRDTVGTPIIINSGYRCPFVNKQVKGASDSAHLYGRAADIRCTKDEGWKYVEILKSNPHVDKILFEHNTRTGGYWLHVQVAENPRHSFPSSYFIVSS